MSPYRYFHDQVEASYGKETDSCGEEGIVAPSLLDVSVGERGGASGAATSGAIEPCEFSNAAFNAVPTKPVGEREDGHRETYGYYWR